MFLFRRFLLILNLILLFILLISSLLKTKSSIDYCRTHKTRIDERFYSNLVYIRDLNILFCDVPKAASTNLRRLIYVYFNQSNSFANLDRKKIWLDYKTFFQKYYLTENSELIYQNETLFKFLLVRHPFRRIYSVYSDKFVNNQLDDTLFGWKQLEEDILLEMKTNETLLTIRRNDLRLDFRTFLLYIIHSIRNKRLINSHWEQIVRRCGFCLINYHWIGKIENFEDDQKVLIKIFQKTNLEFPSKEFDRKENKQSLLNDDQLIQFFRNTIQNDQDFQVLIDYYQPDFQIFHYTLPHLETFS